MAATVQEARLEAPAVEVRREGRGRIVAAGVVRLSDRLNRAAEAFIVADLAAMTALVIADVIARNMVASIVWSEELGVRFLGTWFVFVGASVGFKRGQLVNIGFFLDRLPPAVQTAVHRVGAILIAGFIVMVLYYGMDLVLFTFDQPSPVMNVRMGYAYLGVPVGAAIMLVHAIAAVAERRALSTVTMVA
jgi:C4-dicarboxylate transporter DctQ subunit